LLASVADIELGTSGTLSQLELDQEPWKSGLQLRG